VPESAVHADATAEFDPLYLDNDDFEEYLDDLSKYNEDMDEWYTE